MQGLADWREAACIKYGYLFNQILPFIVGDQTDSFKLWILGCVCGEAYEIEFNGSFDECVFLHLKPNGGGPRIYLKDFINAKTLKPKRKSLTPTERFNILECDGSYN